MRFHRSGSDEQGLGDLVVGAPPRGQFGDAELAGGERVTTAQRVPSRPGSAKVSTSADSGTAEALLVSCSAAARAARA